MLPSKIDTLIVGAGPAGTAAAALLKKAGHDSVILEKQKFPRFCIGESLIPQCMDILEEAGLLDAVKNRNYQYKNGAVFRSLNRASPFDFSQQFTRGWTYTYQVPRDDFDTTLAGAVEAMGIPIHYEHQIDNVTRHGSRWQVEVSNTAGAHDIIEVDFIMDASGYGRVLPRLLNLDKPSSLPVRTSLFAHVNKDPGDPDFGKEKIVITSHPDHPDIWYWNIPFSDGRTSVGIVASPRFIDAMSGTPRDKLRQCLDMEPNNAARFADSDFLFEPVELRGYSHSISRLAGDGYAILGHAGEFLDPVFSSGVAVALKSASLAAAARAEMLNGDAVDWESVYTTELLRGISVFRTYVTNWYSGRLKKIIFSDAGEEAWTPRICSIFAGYVWDQTNEAVAQHERCLPLIATLCED